MTVGAPHSFASNSAPSWPCALPPWWCQIPPPPRNCFFHRQADSHYASNLNDKLYSVPKIEDMEYPAYLLGYAYGGSAKSLCETCSQQNDWRCQAWFHLSIVRGTSFLSLVIGKNRKSLSCNGIYLSRTSWKLFSSPKNWCVEWVMKS
jgi:hypothetical protein